MVDGEQDVVDAEKGKVDGKQDLMIKSMDGR